MLILKTNIYEKEAALNLASESAISPTQALNLFNFISFSLKDDLEHLIYLDRCQEGITPEKRQRFYLETHKFAKSSTIQKLLTILIEGLQDRKIWFRVNTYHFCLLYDCLMRQVHLYNTDDQSDKLQLCPEIKGKPIAFDELVERLFFNTVFLMDKDKFDLLTPDDKAELGFTCPAQFGVLHGLSPNPEEMKLLPEPGFSYTMSV